MQTAEMPVAPQSRMVLRSLPVCVTLLLLSLALPSGASATAMVTSHDLLVIGPSDGLMRMASQLLTAALTLQFDTLSFLLLAVDPASRALNILKPATLVLLLSGCLGLLLSVRVRRTCPPALASGVVPSQRSMLLTLPLVLLLCAVPVQAAYIGGEPPAKKGCACQACSTCNAFPACGCAISLSEGNLREQVPITSIKSTAGPTLIFSLTYNSNTADGSHAQVDSGLGYGWTHTYNIFLFNQRGHMFRMDGEGRVTKYQRRAGGTFTSTAGYFETLVEGPTGTFTLKQKDGTRFIFTQDPNTPFMVAGPVYRLRRIEGRKEDPLTPTKEDTITLDYTNGDLTSITDTYGRGLTLGYMGHKLVSITDRRGYTTDLSYDTTGRKLLRITDPTPQRKFIAYSYNELYQITQKIDKNGHTFTYVYSAQRKPIAVRDSDGNTLATLANPLNWATNSTALARDLLRVYEPTTTRKTDGRRQVWQYDYDSRGYITQIKAPDGAPTTFTYDASTLMLASMTDANGHMTRYEYDAQGNRTASIDHLNHQTRYEYEPNFNNVTRITYPNGSVTEYQYDARGNRIQEIRDVGGLDLLKQWTYDAHGNVLTEAVRNVDPRQVEMQITRYEYDTFGNRTKVTDPEGNVTQYEYDAIGNVTKIINTVDSQVHARGYQYDELSRLRLETDPDPGGFTTEYNYDGNGNRTEVKQQMTQAPATFQTTRYQYDARNRLSQETRLTTAASLVTRYAYDGNDNRTTVTDPRDKVTMLAYDEQNRLTLVTDALGNTTETLYDGVGNRIRVIDANDHYTYFAYDELNRLVRETKKIGDTSPSPDANDIVARHFYDTSASLPPADCGTNPQCAGPTPGSTNISYTIDPEGKYTYFKYDKVDRRVMTLRKVGDIADVRDTDDWAEIFQYDAVGNVWRRIDPNGHATTFTFYKNNWKKSAANDLGETTSYTYDSVGHVKTMTAPSGNVTTYSYSVRGDLIQVDDGGGRVAAYTYDGVRNRTTQADGNGNTTSSSYDLANRLVATTDAMQHRMTYHYDPANNLIRTVDREGHVTCYSYDDINRRTLTVRKVSDTDCNGLDADDIWTQTDYDGVGNVAALITAKHGSSPSICHGPSPAADCETTRYMYDEVNRLTQEIYPRRDAGDTAKNTREFTYDKAGNRKTRTDHKSQVTRYDYNDLYYLTQRTYLTSLDRFTYDTGGRMQRAERVESHRGWVVTFDEYDAANRVKKITQNGKTVRYAYDIPNRTRTVTYPSGRVITERMDVRQRLATVTDGMSSPLVQYDYDLGNRVLTRTYRNGTVATYAYNENNWITGLEHARGLHLIAGFGHDYDREGNKRFEEKTHDLNRSEAYEYDAIYRLIDYKVGELVGSTVPLPITQTQYDLDKLGNWDSTTTDGATVNRTHNAVNEITAIGAVPIDHDDNGNLQDDKNYLYTYDEENRLIAVTRQFDNRVVGQYQYDALSRRIAKITDPAAVSNPVETRYFYDDARVIEEQNASGTTLATYVYGHYVDEVLTMDRSGTFYYHQNSLWSVEAITDNVGTVVERYTYDAYGCPTVTDGSGTSVPSNPWGTAHSAIANPYMFTGRQLDEETGLYFYRARYYDCAKGRFLQRDPLYSEDVPAHYAYALDNPLRFLDPSGLTSVVTKFGSWRRVDATLSSTRGKLYESVRMLMIAIQADFNCLPQGNVQIKNEPSVSGQESQEWVLKYEVSKPAIAPENCNNGTKGQRVSLGFTAQRDHTKFDAAMDQFSDVSDFVREKKLQMFAKGLSGAFKAASRVVEEDFKISGKVDYRVCCRCVRGGAWGITVEGIQAKPQSDSRRMAVGIWQDETELGVTKTAWLSAVHMRYQNVSFEKPRAWEEDFPIGQSLGGEGRWNP